jgi:hypothetical protein
LVATAYDVTVRNELTGETLCLQVLSSCPQQAQVTALIQAFRSNGWSKVVALPVWGEGSSALAAAS